jgi:plasmid stability protein
MEAIVAKIPPELQKALDTAAARSRRSRSAIVRDALVQYLQSGNSETSTPFSRKFESYAGVFKGGPRDLSTNPKHLADFGQSRR